MGLFGKIGRFVQRKILSPVGRLVSRLPHQMGHFANTALTAYNVADHLSDGQLSQNLTGLGGIGKYAYPMMAAANTFKMARDVQAGRSPMALSNRLH